MNVDLISGAGRLDKDKSLYKVEFQGFTDTAELGEPHSFTIHVSRGKCCRPWMSIGTPNITFKHVRSSTHDVADIHIKRTDKESQKLALLNFDSMDDEKKWEITNNWMITYTPYCGGQHKLTIKIDRVNIFVKDVFVQGVPLNGSAVEQGPDGYFSINGTVTSSNDCSDQIYVQTVSGYGGYSFNTEEFSWGRNGRYDIIQLKRGYE